VPDFKNALKQFQNLVEKMVNQKTKERLGLYIEDDGKRYSLIEKCNFHMERQCHRDKTIRKTSN